MPNKKKNKPKPKTRQRAQSASSSSVPKKKANSIKAAKSAASKSASPAHQAAVILREEGSRAHITTVEEQVEVEDLLKRRNARTRAIDTLISCLDAERTYYEIFAKKMVKEPCYPTRNSAAKTLLAYDVGEPTKRQEIKITSGMSMEDLLLKMRQSPDFCDMLGEMIAKARALEAPTSK